MRWTWRRWARFPQALYEIHQAQKLDPVSLIIGTNVGWIEYLARDYGAATADLKRVLEMDPNFVRARTRLGMVEMATGNYPGAVGDLSAALRLSGDEDPWVQGLLGDAEARAGDRVAAEHDLAALASRAGKQYGAADQSRAGVAGITAQCGSRRRTGASGGGPLHLNGVCPGGSSTGLDAARAGLSETPSQPG